MGDFHIENFILLVVDNPPPSFTSLFLPFLAENLLLSVISASILILPYVLLSLILYNIPSQWLLSWLRQEFQCEHIKAKKVGSTYEGECCLTQYIIFQVLFTCKFHFIFLLA